MAIHNKLAAKETSFSTFMALPAVRKKVNEVVGGDNGDRFIASIVTAVGTNPGLANCDNSSILSAALLGEALKLSPSPQLGQYYLVPFNDRKYKRKVAQFQLGYKGYIQLAIRSGQYQRLNVMPVKEGELLGYNPFTQEIDVRPILDPTEREKAKTIGYFAFFELLNGYKQHLYWTKEQMQTHAKTYSFAYSNDLRNGTSNSFWAKNFDAMAMKTMFRQLLSKYGPLSIEMQSAYISDMATITEDGQPEYLDDQDLDFAIDVPGTDSPIEENAEDSDTGTQGFEALPEEAQLPFDLEEKFFT
ncbi:MAG: recombinase RecT [Eubacteriales bacterium]|nr:recombinase RecT [Eubacteriales bacterium]